MNEKYALLSVSDKSRIDIFAKELISLGYKILSTGGTRTFLENSGIESIEVSSYTGANEMFDGRVKTLHPKIHGGILYRRDKDMKVALEHGIYNINLVCVNLYPFAQTIERTEDFDEIIENIDIGGPSLIRAGAKNFKDVLVVVDSDDYDRVIEILRSGESSLDFRASLMAKAFSHTAKYDCIIANYMTKKFSCEDMKFIYGKKVLDTRYGENPHQSGALYEFGNAYSLHFKALKGEASFNNLTDMNAAIKIATAFGSAKCVCIIKHGNPCGFSMRDSLLEAYREAFRCDSVSAYGGVVAINGILDENLAEEVLKSYVEVLVVAGVEHGVLERFANKKRLKIFVFGDGDRLFSLRDSHDFKRIEGGFVYQSSDFLEDREVLDSKLVSKRGVEDKRDLEIAYKIAAFTKSNCITFVKDSTLLGIGMGMTSRVDAAHAAIRKAEQMGVDLKGSSMASEAFFPFKDSIELAASIGVSAIIEPGGSIRDDEVIECANENDIALYFSGRRHFLH